VWSAVLRTAIQRGFRPTGPPLIRRCWNKVFINIQRKLMMATRSQFLPRLLAVPAAIGMLALPAPGQATAPASRPSPVTTAPMRTELKNPIMPGQDPSVVWREGQFYLVQSAGGSVFVTQARTLAGLATAPHREAWTALAPMNRDIWAPDLSWVPEAGAGNQGRWYIYVAADDGENAHHRLFALR